MGAGAVESIKNFAKGMQDEPAPISNIIKAIPVGVAQEAGGQMVGKGLGYVAGKVIDKAAPVSRAVQELIQDFKRNPAGKLETVYHGSTVPIPNPLPQSQTGLGGDTFFTTTSKPMSEAFAEFRKFREPLRSEGIKSVINEYYQKAVPEASLNYETAPEIGRTLGLNADQIAKAIEFAKSEGNYRLYPEMLKQRMMSQSTETLPESLRELGQNAADVLKSAGLRRMTKVADMGPETFNWMPHEDLFHKPTIDYAMKQEIAQNDLNKMGKSALENIIRSLVGPAAVTVKPKE